MKSQNRLRFSIDGETSGPGDEGCMVCAGRGAGAADAPLAHQGMQRVL